VGFLGVVTSQKAAKKRQKDILGNTDAGSLKSLKQLSTNLRTFWTFAVVLAVEKRSRWQTRLDDKTETEIEHEIQSWDRE